MITYKNETRTVTVIDEILCNKCGKMFSSADKFFQDSTYDFSVDFGYYSSRDMELWEFQLCEHCVEELVKSFKIPPKVNGNEMVDTGWKV